MLIEDGPKYFERLHKKPAEKKLAEVKAKEDLDRAKKQEEDLAKEGTQAATSPTKKRGPKPKTQPTK